MSRKKLIFHTFYAEYEADTADEIIQLLYEYTRRGTGADFQNWWRYQRNAWKTICSLDVPEDSQSENASQKLLDVLLKAGALLPGPKPPGRHAMGKPDPRLAQS